MKIRICFGFRYSNFEFFQLKSLFSSPASRGLGRCRGEGQDRNIARPFDRRGHLSLVFGTVTGDPPGNDLSPLRDEISQDPRVLIIDVQFLIGTESTDLSP